MLSVFGRWQLYVTSRDIRSISCRRMSTEHLSNLTKSRKHLYHTLSFLQVSPNPTVITYMYSEHSQKHHPLGQMYSNRWKINSVAASCRPFPRRLVTTYDNNACLNPPWSFTGCSSSFLPGSPVKWERDDPCATASEFQACQGAEELFVERFYRRQTSHFESRTLRVANMTILDYGLILFQTF